MKRIFIENDAPIIKSKHGMAKVFYIDFEEILIDGYSGATGQQVVYLVDGDTWSESNAYIGYWDKEYICQLLETFDRGK